MPTLVNNLRAIRGPVTAVPVVGQSGVVVEPDAQNNQVVVRADETVLWSNPGPQTNTKDINWSSQSLSETIANFEHVKFIYSTDQSGYAPRELVFTVRSSNDSYVLQDTFANSSTSMWLLRIAIFNLNGTSISNTDNVTRNMSIPTNGGSIACSGDSTGYNILYKIIGINRIANN